MRCSPKLAALRCAVDAQHLPQPTAVATSVTAVAPAIVLRGGILNRTHGMHKSLYTVFLYFYQQYLVLFTMVPRSTVVPVSPAARSHYNSRKCVALPYAANAPNTSPKLLQVTTYCTRLVRYCSPKNHRSPARAGQCWKNHV